MAQDEAKMEEGDQSPLPEAPDSRKRPLDHDCEDPILKKSHHMSDLQSDGTYHFKILVPSVAAGAIIGKGGETIAQLQKETSARVKMSKANDFYPGTTERVCLITGNIDAILTVLSFIMDKIKEKPDPSAKPAIDFDNKQSAERDKQVKILVPNSTAGMIIGKGGAFIKQIKEESEAYVQISQKAKDQSLAERCITVISNDLEHCKSACIMILAKIVEDPQSGTCLNVSYADISGPVANPNPTGSPFASTPVNQTNNNYSAIVNPLSAVNGLGNLLGGGVNLTLNISSALASGGVGNPLITRQLLDHVKTQLRGAGFADQSNTEVCQAIGTLINYGIIGLGLGLGNPNIQSSQQNHTKTGNAILGNNNNNNNDMSSSGDSYGKMMPNGNNGPFGPIGTTVASSGLNLGQGLEGPTSPQHQVDHFKQDTSYDPFRRQSTEMSSSNLPLNSNSFGLGTPLRKTPSPTTTTISTDGSKKVEIEVGEHIVGAILGPGGKSLVEIQQVSNTTIQISKKGNYAPGTRNRIVTISGMSSGISTAQYLIEHRINEEEAKRARQSSLMGVLMP